KQQEPAKRREYGDERERVGLALGAADEDGEHGCDQREGEGQHESDAGDAAAWPPAVNRRTGVILRRERLRHDRRGSRRIRLLVRAPADESTQGFRMTAARRVPRIARAGISVKTRAARVAVGSPPPSGRTRNTVALGGLMAPCGPPLRADRRLPNARFGIAALRPRTPIFLHSLLVLTAPQSARGVNYSGNPDQAAAPWKQGGASGQLIGRRTGRPQGRFDRDRGARPARAGVLAGAPVRGRAPRRRRCARTPAAARRHRPSNRRRPTAPRPYSPR